MHRLRRLRRALPGDGDQRSLDFLPGQNWKQGWRRKSSRNHLRLHLDAEDQQALQGFARLVISPTIVMITQTGINFVAISQIDATNSSVAVNLAIKIPQFALIMFKSAHHSSIPRKERPCTG